MIELILKRYLAVWATFHALDVLLLPKRLGFQSPERRQLIGERDLHLLDGRAQHSPAAVPGVHEHHDALGRSRWALQSKNNPVHFTLRIQSSFPLNAIPNRVYDG